MREARLQAAVRARRTLSQAAMADLVSRAVGRIVSQATWSNYELGINDPPFDVVEAAAKVSGLVPAYIAFGSAPDPTTIDASQLRYLSDEELARAEKKVAEATPTRQASRKGGGKRRT